MLFAVVTTHTNGLRRSKMEMSAAAQTVGIVDISPIHGSSSGRPMLAAYLKDPTDRYGRTLMPPLLDARVARLTEAGMLIVGYQIEVETGNAIESVQGWWAKFLPTRVS
jgi:hypothetical protein